MGIGSGIALFVIGAVLAFAVNIDLGGVVNLQPDRVHPDGRRRRRVPDQPHLHAAPSADARRRPVRPSILRAASRSPAARATATRWSERGDMADGSSRRPAPGESAARRTVPSRVARGVGRHGRRLPRDRRDLGRTVAVKLFRDSEAADLGRKTSETRLLAALNHPSLVTLVRRAHRRRRRRVPRDGVRRRPDVATAHRGWPRLRPVDAARMARDLGEALHVVHQAGRRAPRHQARERAAAAFADAGEEFTRDARRLRHRPPRRVVAPDHARERSSAPPPTSARSRCAGSEPAPPSDIYSLGLVLLEALTGERVFGQPVVHEAALARLTQDPDIPGSLGLRVEVAADGDDGPRPAAAPDGTRGRGRLARPSGPTGRPRSTRRRRPR